MINVLVPEAGGIGAINVIKCLRDDQRIRIIAVDCSRYAVGLYMADEKYIVPRVGEPNYFDVLLDICKKENVDILFPAFDGLILVYSENKNLFEEMGIKVIVNDAETIKIASDKLTMYRKLKDKIPVARTLVYEEMLKENIFPVIMKPRRGSGSADIYRLDSASEFTKYTSFFQNRLDEFIFQEYLDGEEYTVDMLCDFKGKPLAVVPRKRLETKAGVSYKGVTVREERIEEMGRKLANSLEFKGPLCFQVGRKQLTDEIKIFEINPRICGSMIFSKLAGVNMPLLAVKLAMGENVDENELRYKEGVVLLRYWEEMRLEDSE